MHIVRAAGGLPPQDTLVSQLWSEWFPSHVHRVQVSTGQLLLRGHGLGPTSIPVGCGPGDHCRGKEREQTLRERWESLRHKPPSPPLTSSKG